MFFHAPLLFMKRVELTSVMENATSHDHHYYHVVQTEFGRSFASLVLQNLIIFVRILCTLVFLVALNTIAICMYWSFLDRKPKLFDLKCKKEDSLLVFNFN
jgi:hypothetical protein